MSETTAFSFSRAVLIAVLAVLIFPLSAEGASTPPSIVSQSVSGITTSNAVLEASIIPGDWEGEEFEGLGGAWYQFQLVADPAEYWPEITCPEQHPESVIQCLGSLWTPPAASANRRPGDLPTRSLDGSYEVQSVSLDLQSAGVVLQPGATYHYRVIAAEATPTVDTIEWNAPPVYGPDKTFTTPGGLLPTPDPVVPPIAFVTPPVVSPPEPVVKPRCQRKKKKASFRRLGVQCLQAVVRQRRR